LRKRGVVIHKSSGKEITPLIFIVCWGFSANDSWTLLIDPAKTRKGEHFSGQEHQRGAERKPSGVRISNLVKRKAKRLLVCM